MTGNSLQQPKVRNFSVAFEQMCNFVAIAETLDYDETLQRLILQCFVILPDECFSDARQIKDAIDTLFGLQIPEHQIESCIDKLKEKELIQQPVKTNYILQTEHRNSLQKQVDEAMALEEKIKHEWWSELTIIFPELSSE
jgi:hypothetical protein